MTSQRAGPAERERDLTMASRMIQFTRAPQKCVAVGKQFFWEAIDLGGDLRVLDLELTVLGLTTGHSITIEVLTSVQDDVDDCWAAVGAFTKVDQLGGGADQTRHSVMTGALRYVRFNVTQLSATASCYFMIEGEARTHE